MKTIRDTTAMTVALVGPDPRRTPGGMATVLREMERSPVLGDGRVRFARRWTHAEARAAVKVALAIAACARMLLGRRVGVAHVHMASGRSVERKALVVLAARMRGVPVLLHLHGADLVEDVASGGRLHRWAFRAAARASARVVVLSEYWERWMREIEPAARTVVLRNAVAVPESVAPLPARPTVLFLGRLGERKGIWTLCEALQRVVEQVPDVRVVVAGDGEVDAVRAWLAAHPTVSATVDVVGWVAPADVPALIDGSSVLVLPSRNEGLPMSMLEAMARGRSVIATRVGGIPDAIREGVDGILLDPDDASSLGVAMVELLSDPQRCRRMGRNARERIADLYDHDDAMRMLLDLYREVRA